MIQMDRESYCHSYHGKLAEPITPGEQSFLASHASSEKHLYWIGISDVIVENQWIYSSTQHSLVVTNWRHGQPDGHSGENCVLMDGHSHGQWRDTHCHSYCQAYHSKLAEPVTPEESAFLTSHAHNLHDTFWIGITDLMAENEWVYSSNLQRVQTTNWASHEPNGKGGENCAVLFYPRHSQWADLHCDAHERFICEMSEE
uniref:Aggrecan core protein n=1 Tax=Magallana gigas TaxID=29159 RepID=K1PPT6_MAGGI